MDLDMRSHWVVSMDLSTPTNSKSLANELREANYPLAPHPSTSASNGTLMELEESAPPPTAPAPTKLGLEPDCSRKSSLTPSAQDGPEDPLLPLPHVNGNLDNSTEDTLLLSFGTLSAQKQLDIIERLELTKNRLLSLRRNNPHGPPCDQTGLRNSSDADRGVIRPFPPTQDMLDSQPLLGPNNEILAATDAPEVAARISGSPQIGPSIATMGNVVPSTLTPAKLGFLQGSSTGPYLALQRQVQVGELVGVQYCREDSSLHSWGRS
ncbi:UNVERIFIED_CONTAM: hypothetical protein K2H54_053469 [Gekko kuhli]